MISFILFCHPFAPCPLSKKQKNKKQIVNEKIEEGDVLSYLKSYKDRHLDTFSRYNFKVITVVSDLLNFRLNLTITKSFGYLVNGSFDGMVGALEHHKIDIGCSPLFFRTDRSKVTSFTARTWIARFVVLVFSFFFFSI